MSTNSLIGRKIENNKVEYIYCHWDGDIDGVGDTLYEHYFCEDEKIDELFKNGDLSSLSYCIEDNETYKDRGEDEWESKICAEKEYIEGHDTLYTCGYRYLFTENKLICYKGLKDYSSMPLEVIELG